MIEMIKMSEFFHPALPYFAGGLLLFRWRGLARQLLLLAMPLLSLGIFLTLSPAGTSLRRFTFLLDYRFFFIRTDSLAFLFTMALIVFSLLANIYALHDKENSLHIGASFYVGSSIGAVLAGDLITLFIYWEMMAISSAILIWNRERKTSLPALYRYLLVHLTGGLFFFAGLLIKLSEGADMTFGALALDTPGVLIFIGFLINAAIPPLHAWLPDAYPEGSPTGSVYLSCYTTKVACYAFARGFAGSEILIVLGAAAALYGVIYALMEDDMRRLLAYHIICQVGYILCGIGIGGGLGVSAGSAHAVGNILFKGLLFMATGALIHMTGKSRLSEIGGMAKYSKAVMVFFMVGAFSISGLPLLNGYVSKSLLLKAAAQAHLGWIELLLLVVAVGTFLSIGLKLAYFAFWHERKDVPFRHRVPTNMLIAMFGLTVLCFAIGIRPELLYEYLPHTIRADVFSAEHIVHTLELLVGTALAFLIMLRWLHAKNAISLDLDWFYRLGAPLFVKGVCMPVKVLQERVQARFTQSIETLNAVALKRMPKPTLTYAGYPLLCIIAASIVIGVFALIATR